MRKAFKLQDLDCANCAAKMEEAIKKIDGVNSATMSFMTQKLTIDVEDDGLGIADGGPGKGLGTKIVKTLVEAELRGSIQWRSRPGGGTRVHIEAFVGK